MHILRRRLLSLATWALALPLSSPLLAQTKLKVAAVYTVPFEQQWVGRLHKALKAAEARGEIEYKASENVSNADYERVMREYATAGNQLIVGEAFAVESRGAQGRHGLPEDDVPARLLGQAGGAELQRLRQLHPGAGLPHRHDRRGDDQVEQDRHGRRLPDPRGEPADERLHGRRQGNEPEGRVQRRLHQQLVRSAEGQAKRPSP